MTTQNTESGPFSGVRVLELADEKGQWCGKLLGDLGADVIKIEPPDGEDTRTVGPFYKDVDDPERSLSFWHYNTSKRGVTLNLEAEDGRALFRRLIATADVVLETFRPGYIASLGLGYDDLKKLNPSVILCSLTPFGQTGPWRDFETSDLLHLAAGGQMGSCGYDDIPDAPPIAPGGGQAWHMGSHYACMAITAALIHRANSGLGQYIDVSVHESCALTTEGAMSAWIYTGKTMIRQTGRHAGVAPTPPTQTLCKDGKYVNIQLIAMRLPPRQLRSLAEWMDKYDMADDLMDEKYQDTAVIQQQADHISLTVRKFINNMTQDEVYRGAQELGFSWGAVRTHDELLDDGQLNDRGFWVRVDNPELGETFTYPGTSAIWSESPWQIARRSPLLGEHNQEIFCDELNLSQAELTALSESGVL
jgi:crotonobetainyl-CoA:carnitine CoA-transferase CaiB-like acyl-CoA transferase